MTRALTVAVSLMIGGLWLVPARAQACDCDHEKGAQASKADEKSPAKSEAPTTSKTVQPQPAPTSTGAAPAPAPASTAKQSAPQSSLLAPIDALLAAKCSCHGPSDCTCKKGECKCAKCSAKHHPQHQLMDALNHRADPLQLPDAAPMDARAGMFI